MGFMADFGFGVSGKDPLAAPAQPVELTQHPIGKVNLHKEKTTAGVVVQRSHHCTCSYPPAPTLWGLFVFNVRNCVYFHLNTAAFRSNYPYGTAGVVR